MPRFVPRARAIPSLLLALFGASAALSGCTDKQPRELRELSARLATLPPRCTLGNAGNAAGSWFSAPKAAPASTGPAPTFVFTFNEPIRTQAFRVALNPEALHNFDKVESRDAQGSWNMAWTGGPTGAPADCEFVKMAQVFTPGQREVTALRVTLRPANEKMIVADVSVLKAD